jgi:3-dehydroquinate dehydratase
MECKDSIDVWIKTCSSLKDTIKLAVKKNDSDFIIELLEKFREATEQLETLIKMSKKERFTA